MDILFVTATRVGDAVLSTGLLSPLIDRFPAARFTIAAGPDAAPLFEDIPGLERLISLPKRRWSMHWLGLYRAVAWKRWDMVVDLRASALAHVLWTRERRVAEAERFAELARRFETFLA